ncbi:hypothetical protein [Actinoplanes rectilineatus]|uniref:hypothetical protein n=1 Tax=Actinoplanes rectilineatus TaxID=113571 RepID=UPI0005F2FA36|nr:hypothetical protein [Actinoplanes rectilineatus]
MHSLRTRDDNRLSSWRRTREFAVPPTMIETATARRAAGDWAGACAAARVDVDLPYRSMAGSRGRETAQRIRDDLRHLAPDLLRWHLPRNTRDGLLRPGTTITLARYATSHLVARTAPGWADAGQRISLALWDPGDGSPRPEPRFRLDLHRHLWDARRAGDLANRCGAGTWTPADTTAGARSLPGNAAAHRWPDEAALLLEADPADAVLIRLGGRRRLLLDRSTGDWRLRWVDRRSPEPVPVLPWAATWMPPDVELLAAGLIDAGDLHPLVAQALTPGRRAPRQRREPLRTVDCRGTQHRLGMVDGVLTPLDHTDAELQREELLAAFGGPPLACLRAIDEATRDEEFLDHIRGRLDHGDHAGAMAVLDDLVGPAARAAGDELLAELTTAADRLIAHGLFRSGMAGIVPLPPLRDPRHTRRRQRLYHERNNHHLGYGYYS